MNGNSNGISSGAAVVLMILTALLIGWIISLFQPRCAVSGCDNKPADGSKYCIMHDMSNRYYGTPDYNEETKTSTEKNSTYSSGSGAVGAKSSATAKPYSSPSAKKSYGSDSYGDGYNDGYDDVYSDGEPDWDRYDSDDDYALGADDAMEEYEEYGEDW